MFSVVFSDSNCVCRYNEVGRKFQDDGLRNEKTFFRTLASFVGLLTSVKLAASNVCRNIQLQRLIFNKLLQ